MDLIQYFYLITNSSFIVILNVAILIWTYPFCVFSQNPSSFFICFLYAYHVHVIFKCVCIYHGLDLGFNPDLPGHDAFISYLSNLYHAYPLTFHNPFRDHYPCASFYHDYLIFSPANAIDHAPFHVIFTFLFRVIAIVIDLFTFIFSAIVTYRRGSILICQIKVTVSRGDAFILRILVLFIFCPQQVNLAAAISPLKFILRVLTSKTPDGSSLIGACLFAFRYHLLSELRHKLHKSTYFLKVPSAVFELNSCYRP